MNTAKFVAAMMASFVITAVAGHYFFGPSLVPGWEGLTMRERTNLIALLWPGVVVTGGFLTAVSLFIRGKL